MDVREKLVELIDEAEEWANHKCDELDCETCQARKMRGNCFQQLMVGRLIDNGVTVQEWISVKDRLPTWRDGKVLVFTKYGFSICERTVNNRWQGQHANWITHWAYLPQPPK